MIELAAFNRLIEVDVFLGSVEPCIVLSIRRVGKGIN